MKDRRKLVMATNNASKLREARAIAGDSLEILSLKDIGYHHDIDETADTLEGNALIKVRTIKEATGLDCFADDTGLMVDALGGAPGVHTARYAGEDCDPNANISLLLKNLEGVADRRARFQTCVALSLDGEEHLFNGSVEGSIATERSGANGFGYDPVFIPKESGICFAEMSDEAKNGISHRGRAISSMMKWLGTLCVSILTVLQAHAASVSPDWRLHNTFDDKIESVFDTPDKTYMLAYAQLYEPKYPDTNEKLLFLFAMDKDSGEIRPYNTQNFLSGSVIRTANYNARKGYLMIVYQDYTVDILHDDGTVHTIPFLRSYDPDGGREVRSISFDPDRNRAYLSTDYGFVVIDDAKYEVASSGLYGQPIDRMVRVANRLLSIRNGKLYQTSADSKYVTLTDFIETDWGGKGEATDLLALNSDRCVIARKADGKTLHYILDFSSGNDTPEAIQIGSLDNSYISENKDGLLFARYGTLYQLDRDATQLRHITRREEDSSIPCGSWDFKNFQYAKSREGMYSVKYDTDGQWTVTRQAARPQSPAVFRSNSLMYSQKHGMLANTHGLDQNFASRNAKNPILLSGMKDQEWSMYGLPYLDPANQFRMINPFGMAQDPDNPDIVYIGSSYFGLLRYNITDMSSLLHMTKSDDSPNLPGHVSIQEPYSSWSNTFMLTNPVFDTNGNLLVAHNNTETEGAYFLEMWIWTPENRRASVSPETFRPFTRLKVNDTDPAQTNKIIPLRYQGNRNMAVIFSFNRYGNAFVVYDHNGTIDTDTDDRQVSMEKLKDADGDLGYHFIYCAVEDPSTGLVWVGTDNGVFTFDPKDSFSNPGVGSRIKVSRNDGTSLADYLLAGTSVNDISIDGLGRKWFSLSGGGLVCTTADGRMILQEIDSDNSPLPSDMVYASCYNPDNNSMMIATSAGLCEYFLNGQSDETATSGVRAYPNPVRHDYYGWVNIDGLEEDCIVKIADSAGNIVRELGPATAGRVQWDVCGMDLNRVPSGVYFVLASSGPGGGSYSEATKILVINR